jgi:hypothetical protein
MTNTNHSRHRRNLLKAMASLGGAAAVGKSLPERWTKPVVDAVLLPAHAATSIANGTYSGSASNTFGRNDWLDYLVPKAYANGYIIDAVSICIDVADLVGAVTVYYSFSGGGCLLYTGTIPDVTVFSNVVLAYREGSPANAIANNLLSGSASGSSISGTLSTDHGNFDYTADFGSCTPACTI